MWITGLTHAVLQRWLFSAKRIIKVDGDLSEAQKDQLANAIGDINAADSSTLPKEVFILFILFYYYHCAQWLLPRLIMYVCLY